MKKIWIDPLLFVSYGMHAMNYFASFLDFYVSGMQDAEVTKSLSTTTLFS